MTAVEFRSKIVFRKVSSLCARPDNPRIHSKRQLKIIVDSLRRFGFTNPVLIDNDSRIVAGHARIEAARQLGLVEVPTITLGHLSPAELKTYVITDNRSYEHSEWDKELLSLNILEIENLDIDLDLTLTGFDDHEIALLRDIPKLKKDVEPPPPEPDRDQTVTKLDDVWVIGSAGHRVTCGDACERRTYERLCGNVKADMIMADMPFNVPIAGHVSGLGKVRHAEFVQASGEMTRSRFQRFMLEFMHQLVRASRSGSVHYIFIDWRSIGDLIAAGEASYDSFLNLVVWNKTNAGMGSFLRSQHELIAVFRSGRRQHINNVALGANGRHRSNVWTYAGANSFGATRDADLALHPTVKPVALIADAIKDASHAGDLILDPFCGSGATLAAAHQTGRAARLIDLDPIYVDVTVRRAASLGLVATLEGTNETFEQVAARRSGDHRLVREKHNGDGAVA